LRAGPGAAAHVTNLIVRLPAWQTLTLGPGKTCARRRVAAWRRRAKRI